MYHILPFSSIYSPWTPWNKVFCLNLVPLFRWSLSLQQVIDLTIFFLQVSINWCMSKGTIPIPGAKSLQQAHETLGSMGWRLSEGEVIALQEAAQKAPRAMLQNIFQTQWWPSVGWTVSIETIACLCFKMFQIWSKPYNLYSLICTNCLELCYRL